MSKIALIIFVFGLVHDTLAQGDVNPEGAGQFRLPGTTKPESYDLLITPMLNGPDSTFCGDVKIIIVVVKSTDVITLHFKDLDIIKVILSEFNGQPGKVIKVIEQKARPDLDQIDLKLEAAIAPEKKYMLIISYTGRMTNDKIGFYMSSYVEEKVIKWVAVTKLQEMSARRFLPCYDEPLLKARFNISIVKPKDQIVLSNMPIMEIQNCPNDVEIVQFESTPMMSTCFLAIFVGNYVAKDCSAKVSVYTNKDCLDQTDFAIAEIPKHLKIMEDYTNIPYGLPKLNILSISNLDGSLGNWGLSIFENNLILINDDSTTESKINSILSIQNAITRYWFGNLVTPEWWDYEWLNEGFGKYFEFFGTGMVDQKLLVEEMFVTKVFQTALFYDTDPTHPINVAIKTSQDISLAFDEIVTFKTAVILRWLKYLMSEEIFQLSLRDYLANKKNGAAKPDDLFASFEKVLKEHSNSAISSAAISELIKGWLDVPGYPVLVVEEDVSKNIIIVSQKDYSDRKIDDIMSNWWKMGLSYTTQACPDFTYCQPTVWLERETQIPVPPKSGWHILNIQSINYCRVLYSNINYAALIAQLNRDFSVIHEINRGQLLNDAFEFALSGLIHYSVAFDLTKYLTMETSFTPFDSILDSMVTITNRMQRDKQGHPKIRVYFGLLTGSLFNKLDKLVSSGNTDLNVLLAWNKISKMACRFGNAEAEAKALEYFNKWQAGEKISADIRQAALSVGLKQKSDPAIFKKIFDLYINTKSPCEKDYLPWVLASSTDKTQLTQFLNYLIDCPNETPNSRFYKNIFQAMTVTSIGHDALTEFLKVSFTKIMGQVPNGESLISDLFTQLVITALDDEQITKIQEIKDTFKMSSTLKSSLDDAYNSILNFNLDWCDKYCQPITDWLNTCLP